MIDSLFWLRIEGKGCFQNSVDVKRVVRSMMEAGVRNFVVDLERCPTMDSTFLGTLTGIALRLRESGGGRLTVLNANARNQLAAGGIVAGVLSRIGWRFVARRLTRWWSASRPSKPAQPAQPAWPYAASSPALRAPARNVSNTLH